MAEETNKQPSFSSYGFSKSFQEKLAMLIYEDRAFCDQIGEVLQYNFFEYKHLQAFVVFFYIHPSVVDVLRFLRKIVYILKVLLELQQYHYYSQQQEH